MRSVLVSAAAKKPLNCMLLAMVGLLLLCQAALSVEFQVNTYTPGLQGPSEVAMGADGDFAITWHSDMQDGSDLGIYGRCYRADGTPIGDEFRVNTTTNANQRFHAMAGDDAGNFVVAWRDDYDGSGSGVFAQRYQAGGTPIGGEFQVNTYISDNQSQPSLAVDADGDFVAFWQSNHQDGSGWGIYGQRYDHQGTPAEAEFQVNTYTIGDQSDCEVAMDADGDLLAVWASIAQDGSGRGIYGQRFDRDGTPAGSEFRVNDYVAGDQFFAKVAMDAEGNSVVLWTSNGQDGSDFGVFGRRYDPDGVPVGSEFPVNTHTSGRQGMYLYEGWYWFSALSVAMDADGDFVTTWSSRNQDGSGAGVYAQRYLADGTPLGSEFQVNRYTAGDQDVPTVAIDADGDFVLTWSSYGQDGSDFGVYADLFLWRNWDGLGDGNWSDMDDVTGNSRWVDSAGNLVGRCPDEPLQFTSAVINTDTVTVGSDRFVRAVEVASGALIAAPQATLHVAEDFTTQESAQYVCQFDASDVGLIAVDGEANLQGTLALQATGRLSPEGASWGDTTRTIIKADAINGGFTDQPQPDAHLGHGVFHQGVFYMDTAVEVDVFQAAAGDTDGNREIDNSDLQSILAANSFNNPGQWDWTQGDFNGDALVGNDDLQLVLATGYFGTGSYAASAPGIADGGPIVVAEPGSAALLAAGLLGLLGFACRRRRTRRR